MGKAPITAEYIRRALTSSLLYDLGIVKAICSDRIVTVSSYYELKSLGNATIKIESIEKMNLDMFNYTKTFSEINSHVGPTTCHVFIAQPDSPSFDLHDDFDEVYLEVIEGVKFMELDGVIHELTPETGILHIPGGCWHKAVNKQHSVMLSFSTEGFIEERLWK